MSTQNITSNLGAPRRSHTWGEEVLLLLDVSAVIFHFSVFFVWEGFLNIFPNNPSSSKEKLLSKAWSIALYINP